MFRIIHKTHFSVEYEGRNRMKHELNRKYKSITRETKTLYVNLCK